MAKKKKSSSGAGKGKEKTGITRKEFIKTTGVGAAALGAAAVGLGKYAKAQEPPPIPPAVYEKLKYDFTTLAAVVDTIVPGVKDAPVPIFALHPDTGQPIPLFEDYPNPSPPVFMPYPGAVGTQTPGAAFIPPHGEDFVLPVYIFLYQFLPIMAHEQHIVDIFIEVLDAVTSIRNQDTTPFKDLPYADFDNKKGRYSIMSLMDKPDIAIAHGIPPDLAGAAKGLIAPTLFLTGFVYYSELCNVIPEFDPTGQPIYERKPDNTWNIIPLGGWDRMDYPGPSYKNPSYESKYEGLKVTIADGKVKFIQ